MIKALILSTVLFLSACATTHSENVSVSSLRDNDVKISIVNRHSLSDDYYLFLEYTFENRSADWVDIKVSSLGYSKGSTEILANDKLSSWIEGAELKLKKRNHNTAVLLASIAAVGGIAGGLSSDGNIQVAGLAAAGGAAAVAGGIDLANATQQASSGIKGLNQTVEVPKTHILTPFKVAPGSYVKRWVVIKKPKLPGRRNFIYTYDLFVTAKQNETDVTYHNEIEL